eukprot:6378727-Lingulodinium_polyedra.AAC.1
MLGSSCKRRRAISLAIEKSRVASMLPLPDPRRLQPSRRRAEAGNGEDEKGPRLRLSIGDRGRHREYITW